MYDIRTLSVTESDILSIISTLNNSGRYYNKSDWIYFQHNKFDQKWWPDFSWSPSLQTPKLSFFSKHHKLDRYKVHINDHCQLVVKMDAFTSSTFAVPYGVPQGSHLVPLICIINGIAQIIDCNSLLFGVDMKMYSCISANLFVSNFSKNIDNISIWLGFVSDLHNLNFSKIFERWNKENCNQENYVKMAPTNLKISNHGHTIKL